MKKFILTLVAVIGFVPSISFAQDDLRVRVRDLERNLRQTEQRLNRLEEIIYSGGNGGGHGGGYKSSIDCMLTDTGYTKTFLSNGRNQIEAEANVRKACGESVHPSYCTGSVKCSSGNEYSGRGYLCMLIDSGHSKTFQAEGANQIEAEAKAKIACQSSVHPSYCGNVTPRCERL